MLAAVLLCAALRGLGSALRAPPSDLMDPVTGADGTLPDLDRDGWIPISWIPGFGPDRARQVVEQRAFLAVPLTPARLRFIDGVGEGTAAEAEAWFRRAGRGPPAARG